MHGSINIAAAFFKYMWPLLPPCIKGLIIVASLLKINFKKYFFLKIYLKLWIVIFKARVNARSFSIIWMPLKTITKEK